jgi:hypothetical protein
MKSLIRGDYHYILNGDGKEELYNWIEDPSEERDLSGMDIQKSEMEAMRAALQAAIRG